jgi:hypothetical protein
MSRHSSHFEAPNGTMLSRLVSCSAGEFAAQNWGRNYRLTRTDELPATFEDLFSASAVDEMLSTHGVRLPFVRMVKQGKELAPEEFTRNGGMGALVDDLVADDMVLAAMNEGASLMFEGVHRHWRPLVEFTTRFSAELGHPVRVNAHVTPPHARGLAPHHDYHDVFVVQISGRKRWVVHEPAVEAPLFRELPSGAAVRERAQEQPVLDTVIGPGDVLYLPRGMVHAASTEDETSIHISIGVPPLTRYDLVSHFLESIKGDAALRASLPMGFDASDPAALADQLEQTLGLLRAGLDKVVSDNASRYLTSTLIDRTRPEPIGPLQQLTLARGLDGSTKLRSRVGIRVQREDTDTEIRLTRHKRFVAFPLLVADALELALSGTAFTPADLPGMGVDDQLAFTRRLITEGFVVSVDPAD